MSGGSKLNKQTKIELLFSGDLLLSDLHTGQEIYNKPDKRIAIFGGSGISPDSIYYEKARLFARVMASENISIMTGGGPGIMEAGNKGACESEGTDSFSYGLRVKAITDEMIRNPFLQKSYEFNTLSLRLLSLISSCNAAVLFPGGFGTLEEMFSLLVRIRVKMLPEIPIYLFGKDFWEGLTNWMANSLINERVIDHNDLALFKITDSIEDLVKEITGYMKKI